MFHRAVFRSGDIHGLIPLNFLRAFLCRAHFRALFCNGFFSVFFKGCPRALFHRTILCAIFSTIFPLGFFPRDTSFASFREIFRMNNLQGVFCGGFFPGLFFATEVSMGSSSVALSVRIFGVVFCVPFFPGASSCVLFSAFLRELSGRSILLAPYRRRFCLALLCKASFPRLLSQSFFGTLFCRAFPMGSSPVHLPCKILHGRFPWTLSRGRLQCSLWAVDFWFIFSGSFSVQFFAGETSMGAFAGGFFCALFRKGFVCAILCRNFLPALFGRVFLCALFGMCFSRGPFRAAFTVLSFVGLFSLALFRSGDIDRLIPRSFSCALLRSGFFGTLFRRSFCSALFCRGFFHDRFQEASSALSSAGIFPWVFRRGISCALFCMDGFQ